MERWKKGIPVLLAVCGWALVLIVTGRAAFGKQSGIMELTFAQWKTKDLSDSFLLISKDDCPHCGSFYKRLDEVLEKERNVLVFYIDTSALTKAEKEEIVATYAIERVPTLLYISKGDESVRLNWDRSPESIRRFVERYQS
ncbi:thioredoxin family protein [uncultured Dubosiella sp.]|uniref:thioredoxin family protein n=1 Tax=uncultured Dubosiella sp. TaxID=1937011 RepID=UPI002731E63E|nr:thioredoxin family protein [uncultured Dubosiella sp.]